MLKNASELALEVDVNVSTVTRFFQKIGYKSIRTVQNEFREDVDFQASSAMAKLEKENQSDARQSIVGAYVVNDITNIENTFNELSMEKLEILIGMLSDRKNRVLIGSDRGKAYSVAYYLYAQLKLVRPNVDILKANHLDIARELTCTIANDVLILFDFRKYEKINVNIAKIFRKYGGRVVVFADSPISSVGGVADLSFAIKTISPSMFDSYVAVITLINLIVGMLSRNWEDFIVENSERIGEVSSDLGISS